jgi:ribosomal protein L22
MVMQEQLQFLSTCGRPWAEQRAQMALDISGAYQRNEISESEYQALMADLIASDRLNAEADDMDIKNLLVSCIMIGAKLA